MFVIGCNTGLILREGLPVGRVPLKERQDWIVLFFFSNLPLRERSLSHRVLLSSYRNCKLQGPEFKSPTPSLFVLFFKSSTLRYAVFSALRPSQPTYFRKKLVGVSFSLQREGRLGLLRIPCCWRN